MSIDDPQVSRRFPGLSANALQQALHLVTPTGRVYTGFAAAVHAVATRRGIGWLAYVYYVPGIRCLPDSLYARVAESRYRVGRGPTDPGGNCSDESCAIHPRGDGAASGSVPPSGEGS